MLLHQPIKSLIRGGFGHSGLTLAFACMIVFAANTICALAQNGWTEEHFARETVVLHGVRDGVPYGVSNGRAVVFNSKTNEWDTTKTQLKKYIGYDEGKSADSLIHFFLSNDSFVYNIHTDAVETLKGFRPHVLGLNGIHGVIRTFKSMVTGKTTVYVDWIKYPKMDTVQKDTLFSGVDITWNYIVPELGTILFGNRDSLFVCQNGEKPSIRKLLPGYPIMAFNIASSFNRIGATFVYRSGYSIVVSTDYGMSWKVVSKS
ncbi:MAG: hypothetical protein HQ472_07075 [Ignavibacteria bacterium]|nr:hypothetical protein [Ignavibacteria bacterium]